MLHPKNNRIDYGEQLIPPDGYQLEHAIGTTYSLDLESLMILPVALFYAQNLDGNPDEVRYDMLDAITKSAEKISVYYQNGQLKVPHNYHHLMAYWEKGIQPITMPTYNCSFHPKVWMIRYENAEDKSIIYRVLISSRNLTFARDWDVAFSTDGKVTEKDIFANKPLVDFVKYLDGQGKTKIPKRFIDDLMKVKFDIPNKFDALKFVPIGINHIEIDGKYDNPITHPKFVCNELLVVSPFIDKTTIDKLYNSTEKSLYILSRKEELDRMAAETLDDVKCYQFSKLFEEAEFYEGLSEDKIRPLAQNLHAKLFIYLQNAKTYWYLGSANCTDPAQGRNIEFMIELKSESGPGLKPKDIFNLFTDPTKTDGITLFEPYNVTDRQTIDEQENLDLIIRRLKYELTLVTLSGAAELIEGGTAYNLSINVDATDLNIPSGFSVKIKPLPEKQKAGVSINASQINTINTFGGYPETALSIFLEFEISKDGNSYSRFLLPMEIELPASRLNKIFSSIINSREKFLKYLTFLLTGEETEIIPSSKSPHKNSKDNETNSQTYSGAPVYEKLLIAASRHPEKLKSIDTLIKRLKEESSEMKEPIITPEFEGFWHIFQTFIENKY